MVDRARGRGHSLATTGQPAGEGGRTQNERRGAARDCREVEHRAGGDGGTQQQPQKQERVGEAADPAAARDEVVHPGKLGVRARVCQSARAGAALWRARARRKRLKVTRMAPIGRSEK